MMSFIDYNTLGTGLFMTVAAHPLTYCKVLIQVGHEPLAPVIRRNIFFRNQLQYPNIFLYMKHIRQVDGTLGLYRGLQSRLCANLTTSLTYMAVADAVKGSGKCEPSQQDDVKTVLKRISDDTCREMVAKCCAIVVSQPFHVIAIRSMVQFVGHETYYSSIVSSMKEIYSEDGVAGFFVGLVPRITAEIVQIWLCNLLSYFLNAYVLNEQTEMGDLRQYSQAVSSYIASVITYPINLASTVVVVSGSRLAAGNPPNMALYDGWWSCLKDLRSKGLSSRGSSLLFRRVAKYAVNSTSVTLMPPPPIPK